MAAGTFRGDEMEQSRAMTVTQDRIGAVRTTVAAEMAKWKIPGMAVGILDGDEVETAAFGVANIETGVATTPETLFQIGSISKIFTTTLIMTLVEEGKLALDTPVVTYVPTLPLSDAEARASITIRHLLTHTSGFYGDRFDDHGRGDDALERAVAAFGDLRQQTRPGELYTYCNAGFDLAGRAAELVSGRRFEDLMRERVFTPLGMSRATYFAEEAILHAVAVGHGERADKSGLEVSTPWPIPRRSGPAGAITTNVSELLRFAKMHMHGGELDGARVLSPESVAEMQRKQIDADAGKERGLGWVRYQIGGETIVEHGGGTNGFITKLVLVPARKFAIASFTNHNEGTSANAAVVAAALDQLLNLRSEPISVISMSDAGLAKFAGTYDHELTSHTLEVAGGGFEVSRVHRNPFARTEVPGTPFVLRPVGERLFVAEGGGLDGSLAEFILDANGGVRFLRFLGRLGYPRTAA
jgi:CubicO group peptidase (beta-lactamase class C family)